MIEFRALYFDGKRSKPQPVTVSCDGAAIVIGDDEGSVRLDIPLASCNVAPPLGKTRRSIRLPEGGLLETDDMEAVDALERLTGSNRGMKAVHRLESHWKAVAVCVAALALFLWAFTSYGIPLIAERVAFAVPTASMERVSRDTFAFMDKRFFLPSELPLRRAAGVEEIFREVRKDMGPEDNYRLVLRKGRGIGANAFALPSGLIVASDELVKAGVDDRGLAAVFAHEMTHVKERHAIRQLLQSTGVFFLISVMTGDIASVSSTAASLPTLLVQTGYSREFEKRADRGAAFYCVRKGWGVEPYRLMLKSLHKGGAEPVRLPFLSTHPSLEERLKNLDEFEKKH